ncbi:hypothetical protein ACGFNU_32875 [Spirillospora sp. NPDC048911]|uniref:hypothetical protein n=1 Tax=Spirillospora sp. NPDC048911 TaxID=3364527 RepID=UPI00371F6B22
MRVPARRMLLVPTLSAALVGSMLSPAHAEPQFDGCDALRLSPLLVGKTLASHPGAVHAGEVEVQSLNVTRTVGIPHANQVASFDDAAERLNILVDGTDRVAKLVCG